MSARVLFVDDDANVLQGLRRMMHVVRKEWELEFADGAPEALRRMANGRFDVVVSDIRMPNMDGAALLAATAERHPHMIRMVLSGQCDREASYRLVANSHQFHNKPCDGDRLVASLRRTLKLRDHLQRDDLRQLVAGLRSLPSPPAVHERLFDALRVAKPSTEEIAAIVAGDMGLTAKLLQLANSGYFGSSACEVRPTLAVQRLGIEQLQTLVAGYDLIWCLEPASLPESRARQIEAIWRLAPACGRLAKQIAAEAGLAPAEVEAAYVAGLLHDAGALILVARGLSSNGDRALVGAYLAGLWGLPDCVVEAISRQDESPVTASAGFGSAQAVQLAKSLLTAADGPALDHSRWAGRELLDHLPAWRKQAEAVLTGERSQS